MITLAQYFGTKAHTPEQEVAASDLLSRVNALICEYTRATKRELTTNPVTGTWIAGSTNGGFRLPDCCDGAAQSSHKEALGVDVHDAGDALDCWITDLVLLKHGLYREHPDSTLLGHDGKPNPWCHLTTRAPRSGRRTFYP